MGDGLQAVVSNANLRTTLLKMLGPDKLDQGFVDRASEVRLNNSSTQVYMALKRVKKLMNPQVIFSTRVPRKIFALIYC